MENEIKEPRRYRQRDRFWTGFIFLVVGGALFLDRIDIGLPSWVFSWQMLLILIGLVSGFKHNFKNLSWLFMIAIGLIFLLDDVAFEWHLMEYRRFTWPLLFIFVGLVFILRPRRRYYERNAWFNDSRSRNQWEEENTSTEDYIHSSSIFGGVKKTVTSKSFKGGDITCFMGGAEYNLSQADISGPVSIEITQVFGGTKLIVPPHWEIKTETMAIFAGVEDKRPIQPGSFDPNKVLIIRGTTIFGGIEIRSY
jgi:predicted membrane protein